MLSTAESTRQNEISERFAHKLRLVGKPFADFCAVERAAANAKRTEIFS